MIGGKEKGEHSESTWELINPLRLKDWQTTGSYNPPVLTGSESSRGPLTIYAKKMYCEATPIAIAVMVDYSH